MCDECFSFICPDNCPESDDYSAEFGSHALRCSVCSSPIYQDDEYISIDNEVVCRGCIDSFNTYEILEVADVADVFELLVTLGFNIKKA